jgi:ABC-type Fe3+-siderophore transport system permease subunit
MSKICHAHCPDHSGTFVSALAAVLALVLAVVVGQAAESLFVAIVITGSVLGAAGVALFVYLLHRDRVRTMIPVRVVAARSLPPVRRSAAISAPQLRAIEASIDARRSGAARTPARDQAARGGVPR